MRRSSILLLAAALGALFVVPAQAGTVLWHRYEDSSSAPTTDYTPDVKNNGTMTGAGAYTFGAAPSAISKILNPATTNTTFLNQAAGQSDLVPSTNSNITFGAGTSWTMEGFVNLNALSTSGTGGQWLLQKKGSVADAFGDYGLLANNGNRTSALFTGGNKAFGYAGTDNNKIAFEWGNGTNNFTAISSLAVNSASNWFYIAASVDANSLGGGNITFYLKDMTGAGLLLTDTVTIPNGTGWYSSTSPLRIGGKQAATGLLAQGIVGKIDEVRISNVALTESGLLVPEPSSVVLAGLGALGLMAMAMRRSK